MKEKNNTKNNELNRGQSKKHTMAMICSQRIVQSKDLWIYVESCPLLCKAQSWRSIFDTALSPSIVRLERKRKNEIFRFPINALLRVTARGSAFSVIALVHLLGNCTSARSNCTSAWQILSNCTCAWHFDSNCTSSPSFFIYLTRRRRFPRRFCAWATISTCLLHQFHPWVILAI